jgi:hypothetical protein
MNSNEVKTENYLNSNHYVASFINEAQTLINEYYIKNFPSLKIPILEVSIGNRYIKLIKDNSVWGFISRYDGIIKGCTVRKGDLLMAAGWNTPAKHSRGNIMDGTAKYGPYGPVYLK